MSKFNEVWSALKNENKEAVKDKKSKNVPYSKHKEAMLTQALLNTPDYEMNTLKTKKGEFVNVTSNPVEEFRQLMVGKVLRDNGIDKQQAESAARNYEFSMQQAQAFNTLSRENTEQFLRAGFTYDFGHKNDFNGQIRMQHVPARDVTAKVPGTGEITKTHEDEHYVIVKKSGTPRCCKTKLQ